MKYIDIPIDYIAGWPKLHRTAAVAMVLMQALAITLLMKPILLLVTAVALAGWVAPQLNLLAEIPVRSCFAGVLVVFAIRYQFQGEDFATTGFIGSNFAYEVACACLACQLVMLFVKEYSERLPIWYLAISGTGLVFSGDIRVSFQSGAKMLWIVLAYFVFWSLFAITSRTSTALHRRVDWTRCIIIGSVILLSIVLGRSLSFTFARHASQLEYWMSRTMLFDTRGGAGNGFSGTGGLFDITHRQQTESEEVALKIDATFQPEYLRGRVFTTFSRHRWNPSEMGEYLRPESNTPPIRSFYPNEKIYLLQKEWPVSPLQMTVWPLDRNSQAHFFLPLEAAVLSCASDFVRMDSNGILEQNSYSPLRSYAALVGSKSVIPSEKISPVFLEIPSRLSPTVSRVARELFAEQETAAEKIIAVESFFHNNFTYEDDTYIPHSADQLAYFLTMRPPAHCEYFATATTILLRLAGVPARYVTGYVVTSRNPYDGSWIARKKDAHAWVEAYDDELQTWVTVETTPLEGMPQDESQNAIASAFGTGQGLWMQISEFFRSGILWTIAQYYARSIALLIPLTFLLIVFIVSLIKRFVAPWQKRMKINSEYLPIMNERLQMDRYLMVRGMTRPPDESLLNFALRLEKNETLQSASELADWYRQYVTIRFQDTPILPEAVRTMREKRRQLTRAMRGSS